MKIYALLLLCAVLLLTSTNSSALKAVDGQDLDDMFQQDSLLIEASLECVYFKIYLADEGWQKSRGLMFVKSLPKEWGMLFRYPTERNISMYMKNTLIPLDMVFVKSGGQVIHIAKQTTPGSLDSISPGAPAVAVLEINGGLSKRFGLEPGMRVLYPEL